VRSPLRWMLKGLSVVAIVIALLALLSLAVMLLWNLLVPQLFHGPMLGYWQAVGLLVLSRLLLGGLRGRGGWRGHWRHRWRERWEQMTPAERAQLREKYLSRCGRGGPEGATTFPP
jgi:hypothetical protein